MGALENLSPMLLKKFEARRPECPAPAAEAAQRRQRRGGRQCEEGARQCGPPSCISSSSTPSTRSAASTVRCPLTPSAVSAVPRGLSSHYFAEFTHVPCAHNLRWHASICRTVSLLLAIDVAAAHLLPCKRGSDHPGTQTLDVRSAAVEAVPSRILNLMNVEGLKREHVKSHLQVTWLQPRPSTVPLGTQCAMPTRAVLLSLAATRDLCMDTRSRALFLSDVEAISHPCTCVAAACTCWCDG